MNRYPEKADYREITDVVEDETESPQENEVHHPQKKPSSQGGIIIINI